jgi:hypothetical protein
MATTLSPEKWGLKESADYWSAGQAMRQQIYGAAVDDHAKKNRKLDLSSFQCPPLWA